MRALMMLLFITNSLFATIIRVSVDQQGDYPTIQDAINHSAWRDTILVSPGRYCENLVIDHSVTLLSLEALTHNPQYIGTTIIDGQQSGSCIVATASPFTIRGFTIENGLASPQPYWDTVGGGILLNHFDPEGHDPEYLQNAYITNCRIRNNKAQQGGGLYLRRGHLFLEGVSIHDNISTDLGGGLMIEQATIEMSRTNRCSFYRNRGLYYQDVWMILDTPIDVFVADTLSTPDPGVYYVYYRNPDSDSLFEPVLDFRHTAIQPIDADLWVSPDGNDLNNGLSPDAPLKRIDTALYYIASNPDHPRTIHLLGGDYGADEGFDKPLTLKDYVTIRGSGPDTTYLRPTDLPVRTIVSQHKPKYIKLADFSYVNDIACWGQLNLYGDTIVLENVKFNGMHSLGCDLLNINGNSVFLDRVELSDCHFSNYQWVSLTGKDVVMRNCRIADNSGYYHSWEIDYRLVYILVLKSLTIDGCEFSNNTTDTVNLESHWVVKCYYSWGGTNNREVNLINVTNNLVYGNGGEEMAAFINIGKANNTLVYNNTIVDNQFRSGAMTFSCSPTTQQPWIFNNVFCEDRGFGITLQNCEHAGGQVMYRVENNLITSPMGDICIPFPELAAALQANNIEGLPLFTDPGNADYTLQSDSPCIDSGIVEPLGLGVPIFDFAGNARVSGNAIDIGCYEYSRHTTPSQPEDVPTASEPVRVYPNPFNPTTTISFSTSETESVKMVVYNVRGQKVRELLNDRLEPGHHEVVWNGYDENGGAAPSGIYLIRLQTGTRETLRKVSLLK